MFIYVFLGGESIGNVFNRVQQHAGAQGVLDSMPPRVGAVGVLCDVSGRGRGTARHDTNVIIVDKPLFCAPKSNADHAESMRRRVGAVGVLRDVSWRGRAPARHDNTNVLSYQLSMGRIRFRGTKKYFID